MSEIIFTPKILLYMALASFAFAAACILLLGREIRRTSCSCPVHTLKSQTHAYLILKTFHVTGCPNRHAA